MDSSTDTVLIKCPSCGAGNRVRTDQMGAGREPICGRCKTPLSLPAGPAAVTDADFGEQVERSRIPVLVDLWAAWCGPCRMVAPIVDELATELAGRVKVVKLDIDSNPHTPARFGVRSIPTLLIIKDGQEVDRVVGAQSKAFIMNRLKILF